MLAAASNAKNERKSIGVWEKCSMVLESMGGTKDFLIVWYRIEDDRERKKNSIIYNE